MTTDEQLRAAIAAQDPATERDLSDLRELLPGEARKRPWWPKALIGVAAALVVGVVGLVAVPTILGNGGSGFSANDAAVAPQVESAEAAPDQSGTATEPTMIRTASVTVDVDDAQGARDDYVAAITALGGRVSAEYEFTDESGAQYTDMPMPRPDGTGITVTVQVPEDKFQEAVDRARAAGEVVNTSQSSYDVGAEIADVDARIDALESSLKRLTALMDEATGVSDVISLEEAISARQAELDGLKAQQRALADQTQFSEVTLTMLESRGQDNSAVGWGVAAVIAVVIVIFVMVRRRN